MSHQNQKIMSQTCSRCHNRGYVYYQNGKDDQDVEICDCPHSWKYEAMQIIETHGINSKQLKKFEKEIYDLQKTA